MTVSDAAARTRTADLVEQMYARVLQTVNRILHNARHYKIEVLQLENPSYAEIAGHLKQMCQLMEVLANDLPEMAGANHVYTVSKAHEYTEYVIKIAEAITKDDAESLNKICEELDGRSFL